MEPQCKLWLEQDGRIAMSDYRARLLSHVRQNGSLMAAAVAMNLSYRRAWGKVREIEQHLGYRVIHSEAGGVGGGKSRLTPEGEELLERYERFQAACRLAVVEAYCRSFPPEPAAGDAVPAAAVSASGGA